MADEMWAVVWSDMIGAWEIAGVFTTRVGAEVFVSQHPEMGYEVVVVKVNPNG